MSTRATLFDIPHLLDLICIHLDKNDLASCLLVSKTWSSIYKAAFWASCRIHTSKFLSPDQQRIVLKHAHHLRFLNAGLYTSAFLAKERTLCTQLQELQIHEPFLPNPRTESVTQSFIKGNGGLTAADLIALNPRLCSFHLLRACNNEIQQVLVALKNHPALRKIRIQNIKRDMGLDLRGLLTHLPQTVQDLELDMMGHYSNRGSYLGPSLSTSFCPETLYDLRRLVLKADFDNYNNVFAILIERCPSLVELSLSHFGAEEMDATARAIMKHCPKLESIDLSPGLDSELVRQLFQQLDHLRVFKCEIVDDGIQSYPFELVPTVVVQAGSRLEELDFKGSVLLSTTDVCLILGGCPRLRRLAGLHRDAPARVPTSRLQDLVETLWVCTDLECLVLNISGFDSNGTRPSYGLGQSDHDDSEVQDKSEDFLQLVKLFGTMHKLSRVYLEWGNAGDPDSTLGQSVIFNFEKGDVTSVTGYGLQGTLITPSALTLFLLQNCPRIAAIDMIPDDYAIFSKIQVQDLIAKDWVCQDLQTLKLSVQGCDDQDNSFETFDQFFGKLTTFSKLKSVILLWKHRESEKAKFDVGLESGKVTRFWVTDSIGPGLARHALHYCLTRCPHLQDLSGKNLFLQDLVQMTWACKELYRVSLSISLNDEIVDTAEEGEENSDGDSLSSSVPCFSFSQQPQQQQHRQISRMIAQLYFSLLDLPKNRSNPSNPTFYHSLQWNSTNFRQIPLEIGLEYMDPAMRLTPRLLKTMGLVWKPLKQIKAEENAKKMEQWIVKSGMQVVEVEKPDIALWRLEHPSREEQDWTDYGSYDEDYYNDRYGAWGQGEEGEVVGVSNPEEEGVALVDGEGGGDEIPAVVEESVGVAEVELEAAVPERILVLYEDVGEEGDRPEDIEYMNYKSRNIRRLQRGRF